MLLAAAILFILGLSAGSFVNALVWRVHEQGKGQRAKGRDKKSLNPQPSTLNPKDLSILTGRSVCPNCRHELAARDLVPVLSWLFLRGRCRYCQKPISREYPVVELAAGGIFAASYLFWPLDLSSGGNIVLFVSWLTVSVGLLALLVYDFKWMLLPNRILYPTALVAISGRLIYIIGFAPDKADASLQWLLGVTIASGIFWALYQLSRGQWIGYGDIRLGIITGTVLAGPVESLLMIFIASVAGTISVLPALAAGRKELTAKLPYGPFLIAATMLVVLFGANFIDWYKNLAGY